MPHVKGAVYDPPRDNLPTIAVVFGVDGEVLIARAVPDVATGEALLQSVMAKIQERIDEELGKGDDVA